MLFTFVVGLLVVIAFVVGGGVMVVFEDVRNTTALSRLQFYSITLAALLAIYGLGYIARLIL